MSMNRASSGPPAKAASRVGAQSAPEFVRGVILEMRRVTWPSQQEWISATILTVALVVGIGVFTYVADLLFNWLFNAIRIA